MVTKTQVQRGNIAILDSRLKNMWLALFRWLAETLDIALITCHYKKDVVDVYTLCEPVWCLLDLTLASSDKNKPFYLCTSSFSIIGNKVYILTLEKPPCMSVFMYWVFSVNMLKQKIESYHRHLLRELVDSLCRMLKCFESQS